MENKEIVESLKKIISEDRIKENEPMKNHTTLKIGGPAEILIKLNTVEEIQEILKLVKKENVPLTIIGNGSNVLVTDKGIKGIVAKLNLKEIKIKEKRNTKEIIVDSGVTIGYLAQKMLKEELTGMEELSGIPGTIGGAIIMNAGAHGKEIKDIVEEVTAISEDGNIYKFTREEAKFEYRTSKFAKEKLIILQAKLILEKGDTNSIKEKMNKYSQYRKEKQPIEYPNAGSTFKRGENFITAQLIDEAGLKGYKIGGAQISEKHAGFIINCGEATAENVIDLANYTTDTIYKKFGKKISLEIKILGEK